MRAHSGCGRTGSRREWRREQLALQRHVVQRRRHRPGDADHGGPAQILGDRVAADADHGGDLMTAMAADVFEAEDFSNLTHWQSLAWHGAPRDHWRDTVPSVNDCSRTAPPPAPSGVAGMRRNHWLASVGITGWNGSESPAGLRRNTQYRHPAHLVERKVTGQDPSICSARIRGIAGLPAVLRSSAWTDRGGFHRSPASTPIMGVE